MVLLSFDIEEFDMPFEYNRDISFADQISISRTGTIAILDLLDKHQVKATFFCTVTFAENIPDGKTLFKCCPPIREDANREVLWDAVKTGLIDFIVSDHSPCTPTLKHIDSGDLENAWGGISALQFGLPLIWTEAKQRGLDLTDLANLMAEKTADFAGLGDTKGKIAPGYQADFLVFDDQLAYQIDTSMIKHRHKITPYETKTVYGRILKTVVRGRTVFDNEEFIGQPIGQALLKQS